MARGSKKQKVRCENPGICTSRKAGNHELGSATYHRCLEITRRRKAGENITAENLTTVLPFSAVPSLEKKGSGNKEIDRLRALADAWRDRPEDALDFVRVSRQFSQYSAFNRQMIYVQNSEATQVATENKWKKMGREVSEDAVPIQIFRPSGMFLVDKKDANGNPVIGPDGEPEKIKVSSGRYAAFDVYDIADTTGDTPPDIESHVMDEGALRDLVVALEADYSLRPATSVMSPALPARVNLDGDVEYNSVTADPKQQLVNRLVACGMAVSMRLRANDVEDGRGGKEEWTEADHMYAGIAAAWTLGQDAGVDLTDLAADTMAQYDGNKKTSALTIHAAKIGDHVNIVRQGMPAMLADALQ